MSEKKSERTRRLVLDAAIPCFANLGFEGAHFSDITKRCGIKHTTILYHFKSKENLWKAAISEVIARFEEAAQRFYQQYAPSDPLADDRARIEAAALAFIDALIKNPEYGLIYLREGTRPGKRLNWLVANMGPIAILSVKIENKNVRDRLRKSVVRDILGSSLISLVTLGPMLDASLAKALGKRSSGLYPMSDKRKQEIVKEVVSLVFGL